MSTVAEIKEAVARLPQRQKDQFVRWMQTQVSDQLSDEEMMTMAAEGARALDRQKLESSLRHSLRTPLKKYKPSCFTTLAQGR